MCLNYLQGRDKMIKDFKFFQGFTNSGRTLRATWTPILSLDDRVHLDQLTEAMSNEIAREIDNEIINRIIGNIEYNHRA